VTLKPGYGPLKVIRTDAYRSATCDFLLTLHSNHGPISYRFRDKRRLQLKIANFLTPLYFAPLLKGFPLELGTSTRGQKTRVMGTSDRGRSLTISSATWIQYTNVTDGRTDTGRQERPRFLRIASRGINGDSKTTTIQSTPTQQQKVNKNLHRFPLLRSNCVSQYNIHVWRTHFASETSQTFAVNLCHRYES